MAELTKSNQTNKTYYRISGKEKAILKYVKGEADVKVDALSGYLEDIILMKAKAPNDDEPHYEWQFILTDDSDPQEHDTRMVVRCKEGSYLSERIVNILLGIPNPGELEIWVYPSTKIKNSPGVSIKCNKRKAEFAFSDWDEVNGGYKGVPKGKPQDEVRIDFWRQKLFTDVYPNLLGRNWDGEIQLDYNLRQLENKDVKEQYSEEVEIAVGRIVKKAQSKSFDDILKDWPSMVKFFNDNCKKAIDKERFTALKIEVQRILDDKHTDGDMYRLQDDGSYEKEDDLPF
jgi:hypothetical protein